MKKMALWNDNDITCARDWTQASYTFPAQHSSIAVDKQYVKSLFLVFFKVYFGGGP